MTHEEVSKACVPTVIRKAKAIDIDGIYNAAHSHLRDSDPKTVLQMQACIQSIHRELDRRRNKVVLTMSIIGLVISIAVAISSIGRFLCTGK